LTISLLIINFIYFTGNKIIKYLDNKPSWFVKIVQKNSEGYLWLYPYASLIFQNSYKCFNGIYEYGLSY
jgi:hypothetical protein